MSSPWFSTIVTLSLVLVSLSRGSADELPGSERPLTAGEIAALIRKLESRKFREREEASRALEAAGDDALNALRQTSEQSNDPDGLCSSAHRRWTAAGQSNGARVGHLDLCSEAEFASALRPDTPTAYHCSKLYMKG
jgi:hypothetical protein